MGTRPPERAARATSPFASSGGAYLKDLFQIGERHFQGRYERAFLNRHKAKSDNHRPRENSQYGNLGPRPFQVNGRDRELGHDGEDQKGCPFELVGAVGGERQPGGVYRAQFYYDIDTGTLGG